jgi:MFS family permease
MPLECAAAIVSPHGEEIPKVMRPPAALAPLRRPLFRMLWSANVVGSLGVWMQNTGAGWMMTSLSPNPLVVSLVQAATIVPVFLLALPAGALADTIDKRRFLLGTQTWMLLAAVVLTGMTYAGKTDAVSLLILTFAIGIGSAMNSPAWGSVMADIVPRQDLAQAIALNGVGFNIARAVGPALAGFLVLAGGPALTFSLNAISYLAVIAALIAWHRRNRRSALPREHFVSAMRVGMRFVRHTPAMRAAMLRAAAFFMPAAAPWAMLPLVVREQLHLGAGVYGALLGLMGIGGVTAGMLLPQIRAKFSRDSTVFLSSLLSFAGVAILGLSRHWLPAAAGMLMFGVGWVAASAVAQGAAQLSAPPWVRSRSLAIYQLALNGALVLGTFFWGWLGTRVGLPITLLAAAGTGLVLAVAARPFDLDQVDAATAPPAKAVPPAAPDEVAPELATILTAARARVLETQSYRVDAADQEAFLAAMADVRDARGRAGALIWQLYEDVAHADGWIEVWSVENWTDHLREAIRMSEADRGCVARALAFHRGDPCPPSRYIAVPPHRIQPARESRSVTWADALTTAPNT